ncbi:hypothetical protein AtubIFM55763_004041 [Aspergillus tubingensis]|uniref:Uncharacterized protein n=1 Tax=Aspergillus tubingensis TaxID=5068 RepID=A0A9W6AR48_ASPTU|nr:hypothetical protein AtubIFM54640_008758 [Aspergillus tubingensis]GLA73142.1 hypothetical protein AtubIFM55763_004041 [Aspergillus tubingensis]GLA85371.1 hypothetical protein AtubIFM56815_009607 [Aspergillus tubingensis]GLB00570.1 hypothetical protein AtubIFM57143_009622 [Aspergillus tubingensis]GLB10819.1 hypothetical protein AtubIFM57258_007231 [Aspergillus tubingensis]
MANMNRERCQFWWEDEGPLADTEQLVPVTFRGMGQELDMLSETALMCQWRSRRRDRTETTLDRQEPPVTAEGDALSITEDEK